MSVGFRVFENDTTLSPETIEAFKGLTVPSIADAMRGFGVLDRRLSPLAIPARTFAGPAVTVQSTPGDGLMIRMAISKLQSGDVLVVSAGGVGARAVLGGNRIMDAMGHGVAALVVDGMVRDVREARLTGVPIFGAGVTPRSGTTDTGRGEVNGPIACGGVVVFPGDVVVGDEDGVVVVPAGDAETVLVSALEIQSRKGGRSDSAARIRKASQGEGSELARIVDSIESAGCTLVSGTWRDWQGSG